MREKYHLNQTMQQRNYVPAQKPQILILEPGDVASRWSHLKGIPSLKNN
jgi:hypothetical protein